MGVDTIHAATASLAMQASSQAIELESALPDPLAGSFGAFGMAGDEDGASDDAEDD